MTKYWNEEEIRYLKDNIGTLKVTTISINLGRTETAVLIKMKRLGIGNTKEQSGMMTTGELAKILKVDRTTVRGWEQRHGLPIKKKITRSEKMFKFIDNEEFWVWAGKNKDKIKFSNIERNYIPPEPEWVEPLRFKNEEYQEKTYKQWTTIEQKRLIAMMNQNYSKQRMAKELGRSVISIGNRIKKVEAYHEEQATHY